jgi:hypothetical protein
MAGNALALTISNTFHGVIAAMATAIGETGEPIPGAA